MKADSVVLWGATPFSHVCVNGSSNDDGGTNVSVFHGIFETSRFEWKGVSVPIIKQFYQVPFIDKKFASITINFAQLQCHTDPRAYWQTLTFITDCARMYATFLLEACRRANNLTIFQM